jgi:predicted transcriptional regulator
MIDFACKKFKIDEVVKCGLSLTRSELETLKFLMNNNGEFSSYDIAEKLRFDLTTAQRSLKVLRDKGLVKRMQRNLSPGGYVFLYEVKNRKEIKKNFMDIVHGWVLRVEKEIGSW